MKFWDKIKSFFAKRTIIMPTDEEFYKTLQNEIYNQDKVFTENRFVKIENLLNQNLSLLKLNVLQQQKNEEIIINLTTTVEELLNDVQKLSDTLNNLHINITMDNIDMNNEDLEEELLNPSKKGILN